MIELFFSSMQALAAFSLGAACVWLVLCARKYRGASPAEASSAYRWYQASFGFALSLAALYVSLRIPAALSLPQFTWFPTIPQGALTAGSIASSVAVSLSRLLWLPIVSLAIYGIATGRPVTVAGIPGMLVSLSRTGTLLIATMHTNDSPVMPSPYLGLLSFAGRMSLLLFPAATWVVVALLERSLWKQASDLIVPPPALPRSRVASLGPLFGARKFVSAPPSLDLDERTHPQQPKLSQAAVAWLEPACAAIPIQHRERALAAFGAALDPQYHDALRAACSRRLRASNDTAWMRKAFSLTPRANRRSLDRQISALLHPDAGGSEALFVAWKDAARRFSSAEVE